MMLARSCRSVQCGSRLLIQGRGKWRVNGAGWIQRSGMSLVPDKSENAGKLFSVFYFVLSKTDLCKCAHTAPTNAQISQ